MKSRYLHIILRCPGSSIVYSLYLPLAEWSVSPMNLTTKTDLGHFLTP